MGEKEILIRELVRDGYLKTPVIIEAFQAIDRIGFVLSEFKNEAYINAPLPIGFGQTISQPLTVAFMLELLEPQPGERILDIGAGSGWQTALLAYIVASDKEKKTGKVFTIERIKELCQFGKQNVANYNFLEKGIVEFFCQDGSVGLKEFAPFDRIIAAATAEVIPSAWKEQVRIGGRIVAPVGQSIVVTDKIGKDKFSQKEFFGFSFVPLIKGCE
mgnify:CR=1 FL=1